MGLSAAHKAGSEEPRLSLDANTSGVSAERRRPSYLVGLTIVVNGAIGKRLLKFLHAGCRDFGSGKIQLLKLCHPLEILQPSVRDWRVAKVQEFELDQP